MRDADRIDRVARETVAEANEAYAVVKVDYLGDYTVKCSGCDQQLAYIEDATPVSYYADMGNHTCA